MIHWQYVCLIWAFKLMYYVNICEIDCKAVSSWGIELKGNGIKSRSPKKSFGSILHIIYEF